MKAVDTARLRLDLPQPRPATSRRPTAGGSDARPRRALGGDRDRPNRRMANRTREKTITVFHGVMERARKLYRLPVNPVADVEKPRTASRTEIQVFSPEEVMALVRAAADAQDAAIYLTAAFTGMRQGELLALRWRDVDFPGSAIRVRMSYTNGHLTSPKSGKVRSVPMAPKAAETLARVGQRELFVDEDDLVFLGITGGHLDGRRYRSAIARRSSSPGCVRCASTTSGIRSARASLVLPTYGGSRSGWDTRTSRRRCSTSTTCRGPRMPHSLAKRSISARTVVEAVETVTGSTRTSGGSSESQRISEKRSMRLIAPLLLSRGGESRVFRHQYRRRDGRT